MCDLDLPARPAMTIAASPPPEVLGELVAMATIAEELDRLEPDERRRVVRWAMSRFGNGERGEA